MAGHLSLTSGRLIALVYSGWIVFPVSLVTVSCNLRSFESKSVMTTSRQMICLCPITQSDCVEKMHDRLRRKKALKVDENGRV
jgi:hypothetical protein